jgi:hypothetical protein
LRLVELRLLRQIDLGSDNEQLTDTPASPKARRAAAARWSRRAWVAAQREARAQQRAV